ncbi:MAG: hypothetical protein ACE15B_05945 [Bryobacteraceae bacterium]
METKRHIGIDPHRNCFTVCMRLENGRNYLSEWKLEDLPRFTRKLRAGDEMAVEMTGNTRFSHAAVAPHVAQLDVQIVVHHPRFGIALKQRMDRLGIECVVQYPGQPGGERVEPLDFIKKHFEKARKAVRP